MTYTLENVTKTEGEGRNKLEERIAWLTRLAKTYLANLTATQLRCNELLDEVRACRRLEQAPAGELHVLSHVSHERRLQDAKWGPIDAVMITTIHDGTGNEDQVVHAEAAKEICEDAFRQGFGTWAHVLEEESAEAMAESDPKKLRAELVQVAAVCVKWIEILDRRSK